MIKAFADKHTQALFATGRSTRPPPDIVRRARRKLESIDLAASLDDLRVPLGNPLHKLAGNCGGQHATAINDQWRICFRLADRDAFDVGVTDYH